MAGTLSFRKSLSVVIPTPEVIKEGYLEVREGATGEVVTGIEIYE